MGLAVAERRIPSPPKEASAAGRRMWRSVLRDFELDEHELALLREAVAVVDLCERLQKLVADEGLMVEGRTHPALVELRQQRIVLARLVVALRVEPGGTGDGEAKRARSQYRGMRGVYKPRGAA